MMITTKRLRHYHFFSLLNEEQLKAIARIAQVERFKRDSIIFEEEMPAEELYFLLDGVVDLYYTVIHAFRAEDRIESRVNTINPGEPFGISAMIEPNVLTSTARVTKSSEVIKLKAAALEELFETDQELAYLMIQQLSKAAINRLHGTRLQLAEAWKTEFA